MESPRRSEAPGPTPTSVAPMLATLVADVPTGDGWAYEMKWDGVRAVTSVIGGNVRITSRNGRDITSGYPELAALGDGLATTDLVLDGEIVALDARGRPNFQLLQRRMHIRDPTRLRGMLVEVPIALMLFDVMWLGGRALIADAYRDRRNTLEGLGLSGAVWQTPPAGRADGPAALMTSRELGLEGVVAKRLDSHYEPGRRSSAWRKIKHALRQEFVVGGWTPGEGSRRDRIGALLIGYHDDGVLRYAGKVGTGFTDRELSALMAQLTRIARTHNPFAGTGIPRDAQFVEPALVAEVRFTEWTTAGHIRHPAYLGLRDDTSAATVVREGAAGSG